MPEEIFHPKRHRAPRPGRRPYELTAAQISRKKLAPPAMGEYVWRRTSQVVLEPLLSGVSGVWERDWVFYLRYGKQFARPRVIPANPRTPYQVDQRQRFVTAQREWQRLRPDQWAGWGRYAQQLWPIRKGAETLARSGQNLFTGAQMQRMAWGDAMSHEVPVEAQPAHAYKLEEMPGPEATFSFRLEHGQANVTGCRVLLEMTPACARATNKPLERLLTRAATTDAESFFPLAASGATYVLQNPRHSILPGQRFGVRVTILTSDGICSKTRRFDLRRKDPLPAEPMFGVVALPEILAGTLRVPSSVAAVQAKSSDQEKGIGYYYVSDGTRSVPATLTAAPPGARASPGACARPHQTMVRAGDACVPGVDRIKS